MFQATRDYLIVCLTTLTLKYTMCNPLRKKMLYTSNILDTATEKLQFI